MSHPSWRDLISSCFNSTEFMALATHGEKGLWVNPVYFAWGEHFDLYFISQMNCVHMGNIQSNAIVACTIFPTNRPAGADVFGAYVKGRAHILSDLQDKKIAENIYYGRVYPDDLDGSKRANDSYVLDPTWHYVRVLLDGLWYFDTRYFGEVRQEVPEEIYKF